ncbi:hypothetical protein [Fundicoccus culcitae]|uniref:Uncharacterized protein n=1 Tax=Fundicoccus culcitae TaxID=2969821 RepID=A0ABY5P888_9LACT|nr:hypothetical protein [Fundicoccus culcitae]UUX34962.1 hypothetical protein NRE15_04770 [Fundicoccus culcitae]
MAKKQTNSRREKEEFVKIDAYMIPAQQAEMYRVLREAVAEEVFAYLEGHYVKVQRLTEDEDEGEMIIALDENNQRQVTYILNPANISQAQKARDKDQMEKYMENFIANQNK